MSKLKGLLENFAAKEDQEDGEEKNRLTNIPFFDIIHENIIPKTEGSQTKQELNKVITSSAIFGNLGEPS